MQINTMISGNTLPEGSRVPFMLADMCFDNSIKRIYHKVDTTGNKDHWYIEFVPGQRLLIKYADGGYAAQGIYSYVHMWYDGSTGMNSFTINTQDTALTDAQFINDNYYQDQYPENDQYRQLFSLVMSSESYFGVNSIADNLGIHLCPQVQNNSKVYGATAEMTGPVWHQVCDLDNGIDVCVLPFIAINRAYIEQYMPLPTQISPLQWLESYYSVIEWYGTLPSALGNVATVLHDNLTPNYSSIACDQFYPIFHKRIPMLMNDYFTTAWELPDHGASLEEAPVHTLLHRTTGTFGVNNAYSLGLKGNGTSDLDSNFDSYVVNNNSTAQGPASITVSMMSLKWAESAMRFRRRGGMDVTYNMYINNHWGVSTNGDGKDNNAVIVLGGSRDALNVSPVIQTEENEFAPAANESGRASTVADSRPYHYFSDDYAYLFQLMHLSTPNIYGEGVERQFTYIKKEEYRDLLPEFQELGDTPIKMSELTAFTTRDKIYGYHNRLQFLKGKYDKVCGNMRNVMSAFLCTPNHTFNPIITEPSLSITHLQATKDRYNNIFADMSGTYSDFILDIHHDLKILRPLSKLNAVGI